LNGFILSLIGESTRLNGESILLGKIWGIGDFSHSHPNVWAASVHVLYLDGFILGVTSASIF
jgi:hypothetical protein